MFSSSDFIQECIDKGYLYQATNLDKLKQLSQEKKIVAYVGYDCTAASLHVGSLLSIMLLRLLQNYGHKVIVLIGDATTTIGDPTGKTQARKILSPEEIDANIKGIHKSLSKFLKFGTGPNDASMVRNSSWLKDISYLDFLREYGRHISVNKMVNIETAKLRLENQQHLSFLEFNYMLIQGFDFCHLSKHYGCNLQIGGSDQWGNIIMGVEMAHKALDQELLGLTIPLLTTASGAKMGKTADGAVWLNKEMLSPYDYYQYWRNVHDDDVVKFANLYAEFGKGDMEDFVQLASGDINAAKKSLAFKATSICHGEEAATDAQNTASLVFEQNAIEANLPSVEIESSVIAEGVSISKLLSLSGLASSNSEGKRLVRNNGVKINNQRVIDENLIVEVSYFNDNILKLSSSSKKHILVRLK